ncbi:MAG: hypothetical protein ACRC5M_00740 [Anaeroplasmataceae bacterium]
MTYSDIRKIYEFMQSDEMYNLIEEYSVNGKDHGMIEDIEFYDDKILYYLHKTMFDCGSGEELEIPVKRVEAIIADFGKIMTNVSKKKKEDTKMAYYEFYIKNQCADCEKSAPVYEGKGFYIGDVFKSGLEAGVLFKGVEYWITKYDMTVDDYYPTTF